MTSSFFLNTGGLVGSMILVSQPMMARGYRLVNCKRGRSYGDPR
jgi:hypothetical protein